MNYTTDADLALRDARDAVQEAVNSLGIIVISRCPGSADFTDLRTRDIEQALAQLIQVRKLLG